MRLVSWNVNGLRAAIRKGIDGYFDSIDADIWMLQETRVLEEQFPKGVELARWLFSSSPPSREKGLLRSCHIVSLFKAHRKAWGEPWMPTTLKGESL